MPILFSDKIIPISFVILSLNDKYDEQQMEQMCRYYEKGDVANEH